MVEILITKILWWILFLKSGTKLEHEKIWLHFNMSWTCRDQKFLSVRRNFEGKKFGVEMFDKLILNLIHITYCNLHHYHLDFDGIFYLEIPHGVKTFPTDFFFSFRGWYNLSWIWNQAFFNSIRRKIQTMKLADFWEIIWS